MGLDGAPSRPDRVFLTRAAPRPPFEALELLVAFATGGAHDRLRHADWSHDVKPGAGGGDAETTRSQLGARALASAALAALGLGTSPSAGRSSSQADALPRADEGLVAPIRSLPHCGMPIVEWRPTSSLAAETTPSELALAVVDEACAKAFDRYDAFLRAQHLPQPRPTPGVLPAMSFLPANVALDGASPRALNDVPSRFEAVAPGAATGDSTSSRSITSFFSQRSAHEGPLRGRLSQSALRPDPDARDLARPELPPRRVVRRPLRPAARDEDLAEAFVVYMGMTFPVESSRPRILPSIFPRSRRTRNDLPDDVRPPPRRIATLLGTLARGARRHIDWIVYVAVALVCTEYPRTRAPRS